MFHTYIDWTLEEVARPFYVGKGNDSRTRNPERNKKHKHVRRQLGHRREIVFQSENEQECLIKEIEIIAQYHTYVYDCNASEIACNFTKGGEGVSGFVHSIETRQKLSAANKGKQLSNDHRQKLSAANKGVPFTPERCENISKALSGKSNPKNRRENNPQRGRAISETLRGRPLSEEHKKAISETLAAYFATHEISHTEESKRNMSEAQKIVGAKKTEMATLDVTHQDAHPKTCPICNKQYSPKRLVRHWVIRHKTKRWCSRACALIAHNARDKTMPVA